MSEAKVRVSSVEMAERSAVAEREAPTHARRLYEAFDNLTNPGSAVVVLQEATWFQGHNYSLKEMSETVTVQAGMGPRSKTGLQPYFTIGKARNESMAPPFVEWRKGADYDELLADEAERFPSWEAADKAVEKRECSINTLSSYVRAVRDAGKDPKPLGEKGHKVMLAIYNRVKVLESKGLPKQGINPIVNLRDLLVSCFAGSVPEASKLQFGPFPTTEESEIADAIEDVKDALRVEDIEQVEV